MLPESGSRKLKKTTITKWTTNTTYWTVNQQLMTAGRNLMTDFFRVFPLYGIILQCMQMSWFPIFEIMMLVLYMQTYKHTVLRIKSKNRNAVNEYTSVLLFFLCITSPTLNHYVKYDLYNFVLACNASPDCFRRSWLKLQIILDTIHKKRVAFG